MDCVWFEDVEMQEKEKENLILWCENIGCQRYEKIYHLAKKICPNTKVPYTILEQMARYDFEISDFLHSAIKFIELRFRSYLINNYGNIKVTKEKYLYEISRGLSEQGRSLDCSTYYDGKLGEKTTLENYLNASSMETLFRLFLLLDDKELEKFGTRAQLQDDFKRIKKARNDVAHGLILIDNIENLNQIVEILLNYLPTKETKKKRLRLLKNTIRTLQIKVLPNS